MRKIVPFFIFYLLTFVFLFSFSSVYGQRRINDKPDREILAIAKSSNRIYVSWRHFATDPDEIAYNLYYKTSETGELQKLNDLPITNSTNFLANLNPTSDDHIFVVKSVMNGVETEEPGSYTLKRVGSGHKYSRIIKDYDFAELPAEYKGVEMSMKFCWPADLTGNGKYDFLLDRQPGNIDSDEESDKDTGGEVSTVLEAYNSEGEFMWRMKMGNNVKICTGHNDMVTAYDMDGDGKAEILVAVSEGTEFANGEIVKDEDGNVNDYSKTPGSAPQWVSVLNGETGEEIDRVPLPHFDDITTARSDKWKDVSGHFVIAYLDGIRPSLIYQYKNRQPDGSFTGAYAAWSYINGKLELQWSTLLPETGSAEFHQVRVADVDGDGFDEFVEGGYVMNHDGSLLNKHAKAFHGDRHTLADIDPDRPGLEHFVVQQYTVLGMGIYDAATGELIKGIYESRASDVGRGVCAALDTTRRGMQFWSTMNSYLIYDCKGKMINGSSGDFPAEPLWWGSGLSRWEIGHRGNDYNPTLWKFDHRSNSMVRDLVNGNSLYHENNGNGDYYFVGANGGRAAFWGDIYGDWREELIYAKSNKKGFVILSTWEETDHRIYHLMQNPAYRGQTTARGYYQTADVDFYMAHDMPLPPVAPVQTADIYYTESGWIDYNNANQTYVDGKSIMFDLRGGNSTYTLNNNIAPGRVWLMNPKGKDYTFEGNGKFTGTMDLIKSMQGDVFINGNHDYTGVTRISEGRMYVNGTLESKVRLDARGVIGGNAVLNGGIVLEKGLNVEGARIEPGNDTDLGTLTINGSLKLIERNNLAFDFNLANPMQNDLLVVNGDFKVSGSNHSIIFVPHGDIEPGFYTIIKYTGETNATPEDFKIRGLEGIPNKLIVDEDTKTIKIEIKESRAPGIVYWTGKHGSLWDFETENFRNSGQETEEIFVPGDNVVFNNIGETKSILIEETMPVSEIYFSETDYTVAGDGVISGTGGLRKTGDGKLSLMTENNTFTGPVSVTGGILEVALLDDGGFKSSIGASSSDPANWIMKDATLKTASKMATNRGMRIEGKVTIDNPTVNNSVLISGNIDGGFSTLEVTGKGTLILQGRNLLGEVIVKDGILYLGDVDANSRSLGTASVTLEGGTLRMYDSNSSDFRGPFGNAIHVPEGASANWDLPSRWNITNKLTGTGTIEINSPYVRTDFNGDWREFAGTIKFTGRDVRLNSANNRNMSNAEINLANGVYITVTGNDNGTESSSQTLTFGAISGSGSINGKHKLIIGAKNLNTTYSGIITAGSGTLTKRGTGSLTLTGANLYTGATTVDAGILIAANTTGSATGTGSVTVKEGALLTGTGTIAGTTLSAVGSAIMPGLSESTVGTLNFEKNLTFASGSSVILKTNGTRNDKIVVAGNLSIQGNLEIRNLGSAYKTGDTFTVFDVKGNTTLNIQEIIPAIPGEGLLWNLSRLNEGIISVDDGLGIHGSEISSVKIYPTLVENTCNISFIDLSGKVKIEVVNQLGKILYSKQVYSENDLQIDMSGYASGLYYLSVSGEGNINTFKVIKK